MEISHFEKDLKSHLMVNDLLFNINYKQVNKPKAWLFWQNGVLHPLYRSCLENTE